MSKSRIRYARHVSFRPDYFVPFTKVYESYKSEYTGNTLWRQKKRQRHDLRKLPDTTNADGLVCKSNKHKGGLSRNARVKLRNALYLLKIISKPKSIYSKSKNKWSKFKLSFITLTLPSKQVHSDKSIVAKMLDVFLQHFKRFHNMNSYIWKAETQENGNLHFHITSNVYIDWRSIANKWDSILGSNGYYNNGCDIPSAIKSASTQIKAVYNDGEIVQYLTNYILKKEDGRRSVDCRIWSCSRNLVNKKFTVCIENDKDYSRWEDCMYSNCYRRIVQPHFTVNYHNQKAWGFRPDAIFDMYKELIKEVMQKESRIKKYVVA